MGDGHTTGLFLAGLCLAGVGVAVWIYYATGVETGSDSQRDRRGSADSCAPPESCEGDASFVKSSAVPDGRTANGSGEIRTPTTDSKGESQDRLYVIHARVDWEYDEFVRHPLDDAKATLFWRSGTEEKEHVIILEDRYETRTQRYKHGAMVFLLPKGTYNCRLVIEGFREARFTLTPESKSVRVKLRPATKLRTTITSNNGAPLPAGTFQILTADPALINQDGRFADKRTGWRHPTEMKGRGAKLIASAEVQAGQTSVDFELSPYYDGRELFELPPEVEAVFIPKLDWPEWLPPPSRNRVFPAGRIPLGNLAADQTGVLNVVGFPELPQIPEIAAPEGMKLLWLYDAFPDHWHAGITGRIDGCAHISTKDGEGLVGFQREVIADGSERITLEPPTWQEIGGVALNESGDPIDGLNASVYYRIGEKARFGYARETGKQGRFLLRYADLALPEVIYVYAQSTYKRSIIKLADVPDAKNIRVLLEREND